MMYTSSLYILNMNSLLDQHEETIFLSVCGLFLTVFFFLWGGDFHFNEVQFNTFLLCLVLFASCLMNYHPSQVLENILLKALDFSLFFKAMVYHKLILYIRLDKCKVSLRYVVVSEYFIEKTNPLTVQLHWSKIIDHIYICIWYFLDSLFC